MIVEFDTYPVGQEEGLGPEIAKAIKIVKESGLDYQLTAMGTLLEGEWDEVMDTIKECHQRLKEDHTRVETHVKIDDHAGKTGRLTGKVDSVEDNL
ncbi:MAG: MTH1187 family thiamine-binding protein [Candidatus Acetothermia bacterium]|nr:MTH1187 family thiamine-binding protein [Candidatus Bipolaricaulota bacterium]